MKTYFQILKNLVRAQWEFDMEFVNLKGKAKGTPPKKKRENVGILKKQGGGGGHQLPYLLQPKVHNSKDSGVPDRPG